MMKQLTEGCTDAAQEDTGHYGQRHEEAALHSPAGFKSWPCLISISRFVTSAGPLATKTKQNTVATMALIPLIFYFKQFKFLFKKRDVHHSKHFYLRADKEMQVTHERAGRRLTAGRIVYFSFRSGLSSAHRLRHFCAMRPARSAIILFFFSSSSDRRIGASIRHLDILFDRLPFFELRVLTFKSAPLFIS